MKTENLQPKDEPRTKVCPECNGDRVIDEWPEVNICKRCNGTGEIVINDEPYNEVLADDERIPD